VQIFYRAHVVAAIVFVAFGIVHWSGTLDSILAGLIVYGIDVAYRWFQTRSCVSVRLMQSAGNRIISIAIPLQVCSRSLIGSSMQLCLGVVCQQVYAKMMCVVSSGVCCAHSDAILVLMPVVLCADRR
jgi:hypothetical protein